MNLPELKRQTYRITVDSVELELKEPTLDQLSKMMGLKNIDGDDDIIGEIAGVVADLMESYDQPREEKITFIRSMSYRQIELLTNGLTDSVQSKKVLAESEKSNSQSPETQVGL